MKLNKLLFVLGLSITLGLASCGGSNDENPQNSSQTSQKSSSSSKQTTSKAPVPTVSVTGVDFVNEEEKAFVTISGTHANYEVSAFNFAFGLQVWDTDADEGGEFAIGSQNPADADFKYVPTLDGSNFVVKVNVTELSSQLTNSTAVYRIWAGPKGNYKELETDEILSKGGRAKDDNYNYYFRPDEGAIAIDARPPIAMEEAFVKNVDDKPVIYIGGELNTAKLSEEDFLASGYFLQFETVDTSAGEPIGYQDGFLSSYRTFRQRSATKVVEEGKAYITCDVSALNNACYNTHCNMNGTTQADCKLDVAIDTVVTIGEHDYRIFSDPTTSDKTRIYGNLGLIVGPAGTLSPETTEAAAE